jgi:hypothetical protein
MPPPQCDPGANLSTALLPVHRGEWNTLHLFRGWHYRAASSFDCCVAESPYVPSTGTSLPNEAEGIDSPSGLSLEF